VSREPLLLVHGFTGEPRSWDPLVARLRDDFEVHAPATLGHAGGPPVPELMDHPREAMADALEAELDRRGWDRAHLVGSSLGGQLVLELAARGRALSVVALAPAGGWTEQAAVERVGKLFLRTRRGLPVGRRFAHALAARPGLRKLALGTMVTHPERVPPHVAEAMIRGAADCAIFDALIAANQGDGWRRRDLGAIDVPVRVVWGTKDRVLPLRHASGHWREVLAEADWVEVEGAGHLPWLDEPERVAELVRDWARTPSTVS
jgi:pimeloyl-ACP methyl ester carboxylesterase